jgi:CRP-like cAMP-binding protein
LSIELLDRFAFIEGFTRDQVEILAPLIDDITYHKDQVIFNQGDCADYLFFVLSGKVLIQFNPEDGPVLTVSEVDQGGVFGWSAALGSAFYTSSAVCSEEGQFIRMEGEKLKELCQDYPETGILILNRLAGVIAQRLRGTHEQVVELLHRGLNSVRLEDCGDETG